MVDSNRSRRPSASHRPDEGRPPREAPPAGADAHDPPTDPDRARRVHIVLLGLMGAGKSSVGNVVADELGRPFVESDSIVANRTGRTPAELEESTDVANLHEVEASVTLDVLATRDAVVFAAAASALDVLTADDLADAWTVWLDTPPDVLAERLAAGHDRPLVGDSPDELIAEQHRRRAPIGRELADLTVATDGMSVAHVAATICDAWRSRARSAP